MYVIIIEVFTSKYVNKTTLLQIKLPKGDGVKNCFNYVYKKISNIFECH